MTGGEDTERGTLSEELAALGAGEAFTIVEFGADGLVAWEVYRDSHGVPQAEYWPTVPLSVLRTDVAIDQQLHDATGIRSRSRIILAFTGNRPDDHYAEWSDRLAGAFPDAPVLHCAVPLEEVLRDVIAGDPLTEWYELVVLRRTESGRLVLQGRPLIPPEAEHGYTEKFKVRCVPTDEHGTVFAVVARQQESDFRLLSVRSANVEPGVYNLTARLLRPGRVSFDGLRARLQEDHRSWPELVASVPKTLDRPQPAHLICLVETCGTAKRFEQRISLVKWLIEHVENAGDGLTVSLISYGQHSFDRRPEEPVTVLAWAQTSRSALLALDRLQDRGPAVPGYPRAAQIECALTEVVRLLGSNADGQERRPVLVAFGSRPAFPARVDPTTEILPCPARRSWASALRALRQYPEIAFGAILDNGQPSGVWTELSSKAFSSGDVVDVRPFAAALDLCGESVQHVPFPLVETEGA